MRAKIQDIAYHLPEGQLDNASLAQCFPDWTVERIQEKTGIRNRHIAGQDECASDLGVAACKGLFGRGECRPDMVDFLVLCTQSPDYFLPTTACVMQERLGLPTGSGALDINLGCSGFIYGLGLAKGLIETSQASNVLLVTAETYSKHIHPGDKSVRTLFGDAAAATWVTRDDGPGEPTLGPFVYGTDGRGAMNLVVPTGAMRKPRTESSSVVVTDDQGNRRSQDNLFMDGPEIFTFTLRAVPALVEETLQKAQATIQDVDYFVFHQANHYMLESLRRKIKIPKEKFVIAFEHCGNTVSSTIPIALHSMKENGLLHPGCRLMLVGFGVGYSWGATMLTWA
jgi:3-oxoacyl-[acyl-carrier-protein] synthase-3